MALLEKKACPCPLDYPCHTFHLNIVGTAAMELVAIAHVDCYVTVPAAIATAADVVTIQGSCLFRKWRMQCYTVRDARDCCSA